MGYKSVLADLGTDIEKCREWLRSIKAVFKRSEHAYLNYRKRLIELGVYLKKSLKDPEAAKAVEKLAQACEEFLKLQQSTILNVLAIGETEEKLAVAGEEDVEKITKGVKYVIDKATISQIHGHLRDAYVEIKKLMELAQHINMLINAERARLHEIAKAARALYEEDLEEIKVQELITKIDQHWTGKYPQVVKAVRKQLKPLDEKGREIKISPLAEKRLVAELEEHKHKIHELLEASVNRFRYAMEVSEEIAEEEVEERDKISRISVIEGSLLQAWQHLRKAA